MSNFEGNFVESTSKVGVLGMKVKDEEPQRGIFLRKQLLRCTRLSSEINVRENCKSVSCIHGNLVRISMYTLTSVISINFI